MIASVFHFSLSLIPTGWYFSELRLPKVKGKLEGVVTLPNLGFNAMFMNKNT